ncbi:hypothetical protein Ae168Ps1_3573c [Pseudonocardia sp. Ae168_Ps1]|uniref:DUF2470 domain-containing protein n=1 Tax=unclassified Pseudonocardia TaxID=2619320 RepID=UPI0001FFEBAA|nr:MULTISPECIES: DUF2470 domain-containing protein [unclassified Pseudonocardia]OLL75173.1 hypothetical protein Ae150APs1_3551c [Pseudonocardia sp. Ae150A_Ps1]OLL81167.1 hypothetical protein Ae168Ps1_3573c [Pseudonocardia sp. Ae168_Ps1]OLL84718.1 hypothetical protein Ae263Ps1_1773 [Pseudonocardia sp. Ae263_Ps1]OLL95265.1 hypothetical protein Ae356Ps1_5162c [Pseudonocardia sp. Ae356_Ps1]OLM15800.1 hypothetical protein Ae707Ps1_0058c [Pseudonocardia sp. Ae707_Ps1]
MGTTRTRRPPTPAVAERARSLVMRGGTAALVGTGEPEPCAPLMHHTWPDGTTDLLLPDDHRVREQARLSADGLPVMLELTGRTPVPLPEPVRELLWLLGRLHEPDPRTGRERALRLAEKAPHPNLLDAGRGATLLRLHPSSGVYSDAEGCASVSPAELAAADPDPFCQVEQPWLEHLDQAHPEMLCALRRHLPHGLRGVDGRIRPIGVDRCGLRVRVPAPGGGTQDVRLSFSSEATTPAELQKRFAELVGCPAVPQTEG